MIAVSCPKCFAPLTHAETCGQWSHHFVCVHCRTAFVYGWNQLTVCSHPAEHLLVWPPRIDALRFTRPPVIAGPMGMGLL